MSTLLTDHEPVTRADWLRLVEKALAGKPLESIQLRTDNGLVLEPLHGRAAAARPIAGRPGGTPWAIVQRVDHPDSAEANRLALLDLEGGASGLALIFAGATSAEGFGLPAGSVAQVLEGVHLDLIQLQLEAADKGIAEEVATLAHERGLSPSALDVSFGLDPLGQAASTGNLADGWRETLADAAGRLSAAGFVSPLTRADGRPYHAGGASEAQELSAMLATALEYIRVLDRALGLERALRAVALRLVAGSDQFLTLAKLRAARLLWACLVEELGAGGTPVRIEAETAWRELTRHDPWTNVLRGTVAAFSAGVGGADALIVLPFTQALGLPDAAARRLARNTQLILIEEANLHRVADPAAGSGSLEALTEALAARAWDLFRDIERQGGMAAALRGGALQTSIEETRVARERRIAGGVEAIVGTNAFPHLAEQPVPVLEPARPSSHAQTPKAAFRSLPRHRLAETFEALRRRADETRDRTGQRPRVFLATLGTARDHAARAAFAGNSFAAGGFETVEPGAAESAEKAVEAFATSGAVAACLCASDGVYAAMAADAARALRKAGARAVFLAGAPEGREGLQGIDDFVYAGANLPALLARAHDAIERTGGARRTE